MYDLSEDDRNFVLEYVSSGRGCFSYDPVTNFDSLSAIPPEGNILPIESFYFRLKDERMNW